MNTPTNQHCFACDLKDEKSLIEEYKRYHASGNAWPEITASIKSAGIVDMQIYLTGNRLFMIMTVDPSVYSEETKKKLDESNAKVAEWESLMDQFQQHLPWAEKGQKWVPMEKIFQLE